MNDKLKRALNRSKNFVVKHKVAFAVVGTSFVWYKINRGALSEIDKFLEEKGLLEEFYTPED